MSSNSMLYFASALGCCQRTFGATAEALAIEIQILDRRIHTWGLPRYQSTLAAGIDLYACIDQSLALAAGAPAVLIPAGIAIHIADPTLAGLIVPRSGLGHRAGIVMGNLVGVVDADYTGPIMVSLWNRNAAGTPPVTIAPGDRIAQLVFVPIVRPTFAVVETFSLESERGAAGFGSTGQGIVALNPS